VVRGCDGPASERSRLADLQEVWGWVNAGGVCRRRALVAKFEDATVAPVACAAFCCVHCRSSAAAPRDGVSGAQHSGGAGVSSLVLPAKSAPGSETSDGSSDGFSDFGDVGDADWVPDGVDAKRLRRDDKFA